MNFIPRRPIRETTMRRRHEGLSQLEIITCSEAMERVAQILLFAIQLPIGAFKFILMTLALGFFPCIEINYLNP